MTKLTTAQRKARNLRPTGAAVFFACAGATVAANVYASEHTLLGVLSGAWTPIAFFMALQLIEVMPTRGKGMKVALVAISFLAFVALWESYWHLVHVFTVGGADVVGRYAMPFTVDILMAIARVAMTYRPAPSRPSSRRKAQAGNVRQLRAKTA